MPIYKTIFTRNNESRYNDIYMSDVYRYILHVSHQKSVSSVTVCMGSVELHNFFLCLYTIKSPSDTSLVAVLQPYIYSVFFAAELLYLLRLPCTNPKGTEFFKQQREA